MSWKNGIGRCFGSEDNEFALHNSDRINAQRLLSEALSAQVGFEEFKQEIESWLNSQGLNADHVKKQMMRVSNLSSYFQYD